MLYNDKLHFLLVIAIWLYFPLLAGPLPPLDLSTLTRESDLIIVGKIVTVKDGERITFSWQGHSIDARSKFADLHVDRILKGRPPGSTLTFQFVNTELSLGFADIKAGRFGMFFLKSDSRGGITVTNPYYPYVVAALDTPATADSDFDRVVNEVSHVITSSQTTLDDKVKAIVALDRVNIPIATNVLHQAASSGNPILRLRAVASLLKRNDISKLDIAEKTLLQTPSGVDQYLITNVAVALGHVKDPKAIPTLTRLLGSRYVQARRSAVAAIRNTGADAAIEPLTKALYDNDLEVRYEGVIGLAEITKQYTWGPSIDLFNMDEQRYLAYWRNWARNR